MRRGFRRIVFFCALCSGVMLGLSGCQSTSVTSGVRSNTVTVIPDDEFTPRAILVPAGTAITWSNTGTGLHTVTSDITNLLPDGPDSHAAYPKGIPVGQQYTWTVPANADAGTTWYYHCYYNGISGDGRHLGTGMVGSITVE